jgi:acetate kinase
MVGCDRPSSRILCVNAGSSSLKAALYEVGAGERLVLSALAERIGLPGARLHVSDANGDRLAVDTPPPPDHGAALEAVLAALPREHRASGLTGVGHRVVHGGVWYTAPVPITDEVIGSLRELVPIDPDHLPQAIGAIEAVARAQPELPQVACFDTAFHRRMPRVAQLYALPRSLLDAGVVRYGFHGLSYEYIVQELRRLDEREADGRLVVAHLGNGASMAAIRDGTGLDTTMGFTPTGGLVMGTRSGDLDPGVLLHLLQQRGMSPAALNHLVNKEAGLLGVSGTSADMRDLLDRERTDPRAAEAVDLFCYQARKLLGGLVAVLGGIDTLVFTGGIGEHAAEIRRRICAGLEFLGVRLDAEPNAAHASIISCEGGPVRVRVLRTNEELMIARHTSAVLAREDGGQRDTA